MHLALIKYSVLRLTLFVASIVVLGLLGMGKSLLLFVLAAFISLALSYLLLGSQRNELAQALSDRTTARLNRKSGLSQAYADEEDAEVDATEAARSRPGVSALPAPAAPTATFVNGTEAGPTEVAPGAAEPGDARRTEIKPGTAGLSEVEPAEIAPEELSERQPDRQ